MRQPPPPVPLDALLEALLDALLALLEALLALLDALVEALLEALLLLATPPAPPAPVVVVAPPTPVVLGLPPAPVELTAVVEAAVLLPVLLAAAPPDPVVLPLSEPLELLELVVGESGEEHPGASSSGIVTAARMAISELFVFKGTPSSPR